VIDIYMGTICTFGFQWAPRGFIPCDGRSLSLQDNQALYSLLGTFYGGDGRTTFNVPDLRGRVGVNQGSSPIGTFDIGQKAGSATHTLSVGEMPSHSHAANFTPGSSPFEVSVSLASDDATSATPLAQGYLATTVATGGVQDKPEYIYRTDAGTKGTVPLGGVSVTGGGGVVTIGNTGFGGAFSLMQPYLTMNYAIANDGGTYPARN
jgi:microcystin-dependent protein